MRRRPRLACAAVLAVVSLAAEPAHADLKRLETEFKEAIERVESATVVVVPAGNPQGAIELSGVLVAKSGLVLTHAEAGRIVERSRDGKVSARLVDTVEVRVPDLKKGTYRNFQAKVVARKADQSSALVKIEGAPAAGFTTYLPPASASGLAVGSFTFAMGNSFGMSAESTPSLTAGVVASLSTASGSTTDQGPFEFIYTTAAINPGVNGGPLVDVHGRLVGVIVGWVDAGGEPESPFQFLGRVMPIDRLRAAYAATAEAKGLFDAAPARALAAPEADAMEMVLHRAASAGHPAALSIDVKRKSPVSSTTFLPNGRTADLPRYRGPVSAFAASEDGLVLTSLYNVTNLITLTAPALATALPPAATTKAGIDAVEGAVVHLADGTAVPAKLLAVHESLGIVLFKAELPAGVKLTPLVPTPAESLVEGRFVLALGNPFGARANADPFVTFGILSKLHAADAEPAWRGHWQTDARATDGNCGAAVVDLRGRIVGMLTLWDPSNHGRASGIGFVLPWERIAAVLPDLAAGRSFRRPFLGVAWDRKATSGARIESIVDGSAAKAAGLQSGDEIVEIDGKAVGSPADFANVVQTKWAGEILRMKIRRGPDVIAVEVPLGVRD